MVSSPRRGISHPTAADAPDIPTHIDSLVTALEVDVMFSQGALSARPISTPGSPGIAGRIYVGTDQVPKTYDYDYGTGWDSLSGAQAPTFGTLSARPPAAGSQGKLYYATDQDSISLSNGTTWIRVGSQPGDIIWTAENAQRTGYVICAGQAWPSTSGIYADLFSRWGGLYPTLLPDFPGREFVAKGTHVDVNTIGFNEGVSTVANRRVRHRTSKSGNAFRTGSVTGSFVTSLALNGPPNGNMQQTDGAHNAYSLVGGSVSDGIAVSDNIVVGTNVGTDPLDSGAYIVLQPQVKL